MIKRLAPLFLVLAAAACSGTLTRIDTPQLQSGLSLNAFVGSAVVQTVSLPSYASAEELSVESAPGVITTTDDLLWADEPERAMTLMVARQLDDILTATVGPDPWPFPGLPDVTIDIRVTEMIGRSDGAYHLAGTYFVGGDGIDFRNTSQAFDIAVPVADLNPGTLASAQAQAILQLSESIARKLGR